MEFNVIKVHDNYLSLMLSNSINKNDINSSGLEQYIKIEKDGNISCNYGETNNYDESNVKKIVDSWINLHVKDSDLVADELGYKSRIITIDEMVNLGFRWNDDNNQYDYIKYKTLPSWISANQNYWIINNNEVSNLLELKYNSIYSTTSDIAMVRPVINVNLQSVKLLFSKKIKNELEELSENKTYETGNIISYNGTAFYVLRDSAKDDGNIVLMKATPLSIQEVNEYGKNHVNMYSEYYSNSTNKSGIARDVFGYGGAAYFQSNECKVGCGGNCYIKTQCKNDYDSSEIKYIVDAWAKTIINEKDLGIDSDGYSVRLLNEVDMLEYLHYIKSNQEITVGGEYLKYTDYTPNFDLTSCWTMLGYQDNSDYVLMRGDDGYFYTTTVYYEMGTICPVVILKRNDGNKVVSIPNTGIKSLFFLGIIGLFMIVISLAAIFIKKCNSVKEA